MSDERTAQDLKSRIMAEAQRLGFELVGVTTPEPPPHFDTYQMWLDEGRHGTMDWMARKRSQRARANPRELLPECKSILVVGMRYQPQDSSPAEPEHPAQVAQYAVGDDYHDVIPERLERLMGTVEGWLGEEIPYRIYTDTGPILERELAQRAGLGWIGKNTCLIHPQHGSYFFLAEVLLGLTLEPDDPIRTDHCGTCTRCIEACPTDCILPDRTLDARRCISYLTIELREAIPDDLRSDMGQWVFGCDICQQVCPWNQRFAQPSDESAYQSRPFLKHAAPEDYLQLDDEDYREVMRNSPLKRAKRRGLARNAAVAAGNRSDPAALPALRSTLLEDPEPLPRAHAAWALGQIGTPEAREALAASEQQEQDPAVRAEVSAALRTNAAE